MDVENNLERKESHSSDTEETETAESCRYIDETYGCDCDSCGLEEEYYCC